MQEFTSRKESSPAPPAGHWPSDEELAAYIDGTLGKTESQRITEHLADCEECYAVYVETLQFQLESEGDEDKGTIIPFPPREPWRPRPAWLAAAAALLLMVLGAWYSFQKALLGPPNLAVADLAPTVQR